jgi:chemotaxis protein MotB
MQIARPTSDAHDKEETFFMSMTDMFVGLIFIFLVMLVFVAAQLKEAQSEFASADGTRRQILRDLEHTLTERGVQVAIDERNGILRLPNEVLFDTAQDQISPAGQRALQHLAGALEEVLPCYSVADEPPPAACPASQHRIETIFIEGHTDDAPMVGARDNWDLSAARATNTYRTLVRIDPELESYRWEAADGELRPIFSVSGYADRRPVNRDNTAEARAENRRIDLRFVMAGPRPSALEDIDTSIRGRDR